MNNLFDKVFSIDEIKVSALVLILIVTSIFGLVMYVLDGDITANLLTFMSTLIYSIVGINAFNLAKEGITNFKNTKEESNFDSSI
ncbi:hypothetical protein [Chengkuizengella axinellae]|uniref:Uncharacterized protein n=1 Tax=Chengkuizengella axinellae TaxID=3064388 RepID=A0ABT9J4A5_9BACL|nr:hypothetical protein [Chengkuizengella sp. 2205SS18-9]MDP5276476.1 hypothetical protein [Chengkuizengella sp. 2205SS18-9]